MCPAFSKLALCVSLIGSSLFASCGSGSHGSGGSSGSSLTVALTDVASDDIASFTVGINTILLVRPDGSVVSALPSPVTVDLLMLSSMSQVLNVLNVPAGNFESASLTLDFTRGSAYLVGNNTPATILDADGNTIVGSLTLPIAIGKLLKVRTRAHRILELDFDLDQSLVTDPVANTVTVEPMIVPRVNRNDPKELFLGGSIQSIDALAGTVNLELQTRSRARITDVVLDVDANTVYQVDGLALQGAAGLAALSGLRAGSWLQCYGAMDLVRGRICADYVEAGAGTFNGNKDIVEGHVVGRVGGAGNDPTFLILGRSTDRTHTNALFNTTFTVRGSFANTRVVRRGSVVPCDTDDINIGQRVRLFGDLVGTSLDISMASGVARLQPTRISGFADIASSSLPGSSGDPDVLEDLGITKGTVVGTTLGIDVSRVGVRDQGAFLWNEGGTTPPDPDAFSIEIGKLADGLGIANGSAVEIVGFCTAVDDDDADFEAIALVNRDRAPALFAIHDRFGGMNVTTIVNRLSLQFTITSTPGTDEFATVNRGFLGATPLRSSPTPTVSPAGAFGLYMITDRVTGAVSLHLNFTSFTQELGLLISQGAEVRNFGAVGQFDVPSNVMSSGLVGVVLD